MIWSCIRLISLCDFPRGDLTGLNTTSSSHLHDTSLQRVQPTHTNSPLPFSKIIEPPVRSYQITSLFHVQTHTHIHSPLLVRPTRAYIHLCAVPHYTHSLSPSKKHIIIPGLTTPVQAHNGANTTLRYRRNFSAPSHIKGRQQRILILYLARGPCPARHSRGETHHPRRAALRQCCTERRRAYSKART